MHGIFERKEIGKAAKPMVDTFDSFLHRTRRVMEHARQKERNIDFPCIIGMNESRKPRSFHYPVFESVMIRKLHGIDSLANHASSFTNDCRRYPNRTIYWIGGSCVFFRVDVLCFYFQKAQIPNRLNLNMIT